MNTVHQPCCAASPEGANSLLPAWCAPSSKAGIIAPELHPQQGWEHPKDSDYTGIFFRADEQRREWRFPGSSTFPSTRHRVQFSHLLHAHSSHTAPYEKVPFCGHTGLRFYLRWKFGKQGVGAGRQSQGVYKRGKITNVFYAAL